MGQHCNPILKPSFTEKNLSHGEVQLLNISEGHVFFDCIFVPVLTEEGKLESVAGTMRDITDRKIADDKNWHRANYDELTGLPNRTLFCDRLEQAVLHAGRSGTKIALLFIDLDHFKEVNDNLGHGVGDLLLKFAADRIRSCVRQADTVARLGGDEFTVILHNVVDAAHVRTVAKKIVKEMTSAFQIFEHSIAISASVGVSLSPQDAQTPTSLMKNADLAMYAAKSAGRNRVEFFSPDQLGRPSESTFGRL